MFFNRRVYVLTQEKKNVQSECSYCYITLRIYDLCWHEESESLFVARIRHDAESQAITFELTKDTGETKRKHTKLAMIYAGGKSAKLCSQDKIRRWVRGHYNWADQRHAGETWRKHVKLAHEFAAMLGPYHTIFNWVKTRPSRPRCSSSQSYLIGKCKEYIQAGLATHTGPDNEVRLGTTLVLPFFSMIRSRTQPFGYFWHLCDP